MNIQHHPAQSRGHASHGWLDSYHTYSFASYYNRNRMGLGTLRVINDDTVEPGRGFDTHSHDNMEIISIPLSGALAHRDSMDNVKVIREGEIQIMSAGTGVTHSEYNHSDSEQVNFLQIWVLPKQRDIEPRYEQHLFDQVDRRDQFQLIISPDGEGDSLTINQDAWFSLIDFADSDAARYSARGDDHAIYAFVIEGSIEVDGQSYGKRDGLEIRDVADLDISADSGTRLLIMEVPLD